MVSSLNDRSRQCLLVHLLVLVQRNTVNLHRSSRNHVWRLLFADEGIQFLDVNLLIADDIGSNKLTAIVIVKGLHGNILDAMVFANHSLYLLHLDAEATNLHLTVAATHELYVAVRQIAHDVA